MADKLIAVFSCFQNTVINGESEFNYNGRAVASAGDANGNGLDDLIVSADQADPSGKPNAGKSYIIFGKQDNTDAINLSAIATGTSTGGFVINADSPLITKPSVLVPAAMADKLIAVLSCLPNTTYDLPADDLLFGSA
jgi:hypothetical protein